MKTSTIVLRYLSVLGLVAGIFLSFLDMRFGAIAFLCSTAFAYLAHVLRSDKHAADMQETMSIVMSLVAQTKQKADSLTA